MTQKQMRRHIRKVKGSAIMAGVLAFIAVVAIACAVILANTSYKRWLHPSGDAASQAKTVMRAISLYPDKAEGYQLLMDIYLEDSVLGQTESESLRSLLNQHQERLNQKFDQSVPLYNRIGFAYIACYDADAEARLRASLPYFGIIRDSLTEGSPERIAVSTYLDIGSYCSEYLWLTGSLRVPDKETVESLIADMVTTLEALQGKNDRDRLAAACCFDYLLARHGSLWEDTVEPQLVQGLSDAIREQCQKTVSDPAALRLLAELTGQKNEMEEA